LYPKKEKKRKNERMKERKEERKKIVRKGGNDQSDRQKQTRQKSCPTFLQPKVTTSPQSETFFLATLHFLI
jgi:hypothetical protein